MVKNAKNQSPYGGILSEWRKRRRFSQLTFALYADVSSRHLSFLETGRASPSREMVLKLADCLKMPKAETNRALLAAGFSPAYQERTNSNVDLAPIQLAINSLLANQMPYPAIVLDRHWNLIGANDVAKNLLEAVGFAGYKNLLEALADQSKIQSSIVNWEESIGLVLERLRTEIEFFGEDTILIELEYKLATSFNKHCLNPKFNRSQAIIPTQFRIGENIISLFSSIAQFGTVQDLSLYDIKVELMFPMNDTSRDYFNSLSSNA